MGKKISIIIVTYNSDDYISDCLNSIFTMNDIGDSLEVIIVDNMSRNVDTMFSKINSIYGDRVKLIRNTKNGGYGQGNNVGIRLSTSPIIMIMNPDVRLTSPIFSKVIAWFSKPNIAMVGMQQLVSKDKMGPSFAIKLKFNPILRVFLTYISHKFQFYIQRLMYFSGAAFFIKKDIFYNIGLFDENLFLYGEENDLHNRLLNYDRKLKLVYDKNMKYIHQIDNRPFSEKAYNQMIQSGLYFCKKNSLNKSNYIKNKIRYEKTWILIEKIRRSKYKQNLHKKNIEILKQYL